MSEIPYPAPVAHEVAERLVDQQVGLGWTYPTQGPEQRADAIARQQRKMRLKLWLHNMGVAPTAENRRAYVEKRRSAFHDRIRREREGKDGEA